MNLLFRLQQLFDTANYSYILPTHRITIYLFGILAAFILNKNRKIAFTSVSKTWISIEILIPRIRLPKVLITMITSLSKSFFLYFSFKYDSSGLQVHFLHSPQLSDHIHQLQKHMFIIQYMQHGIMPSLQLFGDYFYFGVSLQLITAMVVGLVISWIGKNFKYFLELPTHSI